ncbi:MAG: sigma-70 family RNA polymerase sigma factor [Syntrophobacteraceae bacterium]|nr:sigma-70 family RNA polymerase sigma factor [Syntrophobacteraceae bacterium]
MREKPAAEPEGQPQEEFGWIRAFQAGERDAFDRLVLRYQDRIVNLCFRMLADREEAFDSAQETFVKAFRSLGGFQFRSSFSTWLYAIAANTCRNRLASLEHRVKSRTLPLNPSARSDEWAVGMDLEDPSPSPLAQLSTKERDRLVQEAISSLPGDGRTVVVLRDVEGLSYEEITEITGYNLGTVKSKLARARQQLRERLKGVI